MYENTCFEVFDGSEREKQSVRIIEKVRSVMRKVVGGEKMKKKSFVCVAIISCLIMMFFGGCGKEKTVDTKLTVQEIQWNEMGSSTEDPVVFTPLKSGDVVYDQRDYKLVVKSVSKDKIVLSGDGYLVETNEDGTIDLRKDPIKEIKIEAGQSVELASQTMDAGIHLIITY